MSDPAPESPIHHRRNLHFPHHQSHPPHRHSRHRQTSDDHKAGIFRRFLDTVEGKPHGTSERSQATSYDPRSPQENERFSDQDDQDEGYETSSPEEEESSTTAPRPTRPILDPGPRVAETTSSRSSHPLSTAEQQAVNLEWIKQHAAQAQPDRVSREHLRPPRPALAPIRSPGYPISSPPSEDWASSATAPAYQPRERAPTAPFRCDPSPPPPEPRTTRYQSSHDDNDTEASLASPSDIEQHNRAASQSTRARPERVPDRTLQNPQPRPTTAGASTGEARSFAFRAPLSDRSQPNPQPEDEGYESSDPSDRDAARNFPAPSLRRSRAPSSEPCSSRASSPARQDFESLQEYDAPQSAPRADGQERPETVINDENRGRFAPDYSGRHRISRRDDPSDKDRDDDSSDVEQNRRAREVTLGPRPSPIAYSARNETSSQRSNFASNLERPSGDSIAGERDLSNPVSRRRNAIGSTEQQAYSSSPLRQAPENDSYLTPSPVFSEGPAPVAVVRPRDEVSSPVSSNIAAETLAYDPNLSDSEVPAPSRRPLPGRRSSESYRDASDAGVQTADDSMPIPMQNDPINLRPTQLQDYRRRDSQDLDPESDERPDPLSRSNPPRRPVERAESDEPAFRPWTERDRDNANVQEDREDEDEQRSGPANFQPVSRHQDSVRPFPGPEVLDNESQDRQAPLARTVAVATANTESSDPRPNLSDDDDDDARPSEDTGRWGRSDSDDEEPRQQSGRQGPDAPYSTSRGAIAPGQPRDRADDAVTDNDDSPRDERQDAEWPRREGPFTTTPFTPETRNGSTREDTRDEDSRVAQPDDARDEQTSYVDSDPQDPHLSDRRESRSEPFQELYPDRRPHEPNNRDRDGDEDSQINSEDQTPAFRQWGRQLDDSDSRTPVLTERENGPSYATDRDDDNQDEDRRSGETPRAEASLSNESRPRDSSRERRDDGDDEEDDMRDSLNEGHPQPRRFEDDDDGEAQTESSPSQNDYKSETQSARPVPPDKDEGYESDPDDRQRQDLVDKSRNRRRSQYDDSGDDAADGASFAEPPQARETYDDADVGDLRAEENFKQDDPIDSDRSPESSWQSRERRSDERPSAPSPSFDAERDPEQDLGTQYPPDESDISPGRNQRYEDQGTGGRDGFGRGDLRGFANQEETGDDFDRGRATPSRTSYDGGADDFDSDNNQGWPAAQDDPGNFRSQERDFQKGSFDRDGLQSDSFADGYQRQGESALDYDGAGYGQQTRSDDFGQHDSDPSLDYDRGGGSYARRETFENQYDTGYGASGYNDHYGQGSGNDYGNEISGDNGYYNSNGYANGRENLYEREGDGQLGSDNGGPPFQSPDPYASSGPYMAGTQSYLPRMQPSHYSSYERTSSSQTVPPLETADTKYRDAFQHYREALQHLRQDIRKRPQVHFGDIEHSAHKVFAAVHALRAIEEQEGRQLTRIPSASELELTPDEYHTCITTFQKHTADALEAAHRDLRHEDSPENRRALSQARARHDAALQHGYDHHSSERNLHMLAEEDPDAELEDVGKRASSRPFRSLTSVRFKHGDPDQIEAAKTRLRNARGRQREAHDELEQAEAVHKRDNPQTAVDTHSATVRERQAAQAHVDDQQARLKAAEETGNTAQVQHAQRQLEIAQARLTHAESAEKRSKHELKPEDRLEIARASKEEAERHLVRVQEQYQRGEVSRQEVEHARISRERAKGEYKAASESHQRARDRVVLGTYRTPTLATPPKNVCISRFRLLRGSAASGVLEADAGTFIFIQV
ncbi:uncharacterized protein JCM15063_001080, partial [Sporobolomyces koalae]|uniref:uncharacterized protein n=1 Tax=Sporobolomyces koalae TaxID=500713 RepID=UPI00317FCBD0